MLKTSAHRCGFAADYHFYKMFWVFVVCSVAGCFIETAYELILHGRLDSRVGMLYGPFSQIYGFAAVIMILFLHKLGIKRLFFLFVASALIGAAFEFASSLIQEHVFGSISWDYSAMPLNIFGRTSLIYSLYWGILGAFLIRTFYPFLSNLIEKLPCRTGLIITWLLIICISLDGLVSSAAVYREHQRHHNVPATNSLQVLLDNQYPDSFIKKKYPNMIHV